LLNSLKRKQAKREYFITNLNYLVCRIAKKKPSFFLTLASLNDEASPEEEDLTPEYEKKDF